MIRYHDRWAVVTGASSGLGRGIAARLAEKGMSLVLTGRNEARLHDTVEQIRRTKPDATLELVVADLSTREGVSALLDHIGNRPIEVLVNNAGFGSYGPFAEADLARETDEVGVDVSAVLTLARALLPGMIERQSGGILNVASTIAFQPAPYQAVYGACKAFVLSFSQALWAEARSSGVAVTALCPGPTRTGFVEALGANVGHTTVYRRLAEPGPVIEAGLRGFEKGHAVVIPGIKNQLLAASGRFTPREWMARLTGRLLGAKAAPRPPIDVQNEIVVKAPADRVWDLLSNFDAWPSWHGACRWVKRIESKEGTEQPAAFRWKAHPVVLESSVIASERPRSFAFSADAKGLHAEHAFTIVPSPDGSSTVVVSHETQRGPLPWVGRAFLSRHLDAANKEWLADLARAATGEAPTTSQSAS